MALKSDTSTPVKEPLTPGAGREMEQAAELSGNGGVRGCWVSVTVTGVHSRVSTLGSWTRTVRPTSIELRQ